MIENRVFEEHLQQLLLDGEWLEELRIERRQRRRFDSDSYDPDTGWSVCGGFGCSVIFAFFFDFNFVMVLYGWWRRATKNKGNWRKMMKGRTSWLSGVLQQLMKKIWRCFARLGIWVQEMEKVDLRLTSGRDNIRSFPNSKIDLWNCNLEIIILSIRELSGIDSSEEN